MNSTTEQSGNQLTLKITAEEADLSPTVRSVYNHLRQSVEAKGFRPGKAPNEVVDRELGAQRVQAEVVNAAAEKLYRQVVEEHGIQPISNPHVEVKKIVPYSELELEITVEVIPEIKLPDYTQGLRITTEELSVSDEEVNEVLGSLQERLATREPVERKASSGDEVTLDFHGRKNGEDVPGAQEKQYSLVLGSGNFIPGFEEELSGLQAGDEKTFTITFPEEYPEESLAGEQIEFDVKIHSVSEVSKPELNDEFAQSAGPFEGLESLKSDVRNHLQSEREQADEKRKQNEVLAQLIEKTEIEVPESMLEQEKQQLWQDIDKRLQEQGMSREDYIAQSGRDEAELEQEVQSQAVDRAKTALVLTEVAKRENLEVTADELDVRMQAIAGQYQDEKVQEELQKPEVRREISNQMLAEKTVQRLMEYATQTQDGSGKGSDTTKKKASTGEKSADSQSKSQTGTKSGNPQSTKAAKHNKSRTAPQADQQQASEPGDTGSSE